MAVFLEINRLEVNVDEADVVGTMVGLAAGGLDEDALAGWIREHATDTGGEAR